MAQVAALTEYGARDYGNGFTFIRGSPPLPANGEPFLQSAEASVNARMEPQPGSKRHARRVDLGGDVPSDVAVVPRLTAVQVCVSVPGG